MLSFNSEISPDGPLQPQSSRLLPLSSLPTYVALLRQRFKSLLPLIQLKRSHEESVQEGTRFHQFFFGTIPVPSPSIQALEVPVFSLLSLSPTNRDSSGVVIVPSSSCFDGFGDEYFAGEEPISGAVFVTSSGPTELTTVAINGVFDLIAGFRGPGTSESSALVFWRGLFPGTVALNFESHLWVLMLMQGDGVGHHLPLFFVL